MASLCDKRYILAEFPPPFLGGHGGATGPEPFGAGYVVKWGNQL